MTSRISFSSILKEDLRRRIWMLALSCLGSFLAMPITFLLTNRDYLVRINRAGTHEAQLDRILEYYVEYFTSVGAAMQGIILFAGAVIVAVFGFRYLYSRKMVDLYHSIPVKRSRLFAATYLNGLLIWLLPMLLSMGITLLMMVFNLATHDAMSVFGPIAMTALKLTVLSVFCFLIVYHFCLVCTMLCGNAYNALFVIALLGTFVCAVFGILLSFYDGFFETYYMTVFSVNQLSWASPLIAPILLLVDFGNTGTSVLFWNTAHSVYDHCVFLQTMSFLLMVFHLYLALKLYEKRPSELAEHGVDSKPMQSIVRLAAGILAALFGCMIFLWMLDRSALAWQMFGILLCGILAFGITDIILHMNFKSFFAHKGQMAIAVAVPCLILAIFAFDLTGFDSRIPTKKSIREVELNLNGYGDGGSYYYTAEGSDTLYPVDKTFDDMDAFYPFLQAMIDTAHLNKEGDIVGSFTVAIDTSFGPFYRRYWYQEQDAELLRAIVESDEYREKRYRVSSGLTPDPDGMSIYSNMNHSQETVPDEQIAAIMDAYTADFLEHYKLETLESGVQVAEIYAYYPPPRNFL